MKSKIVALTIVLIVGAGIYWLNRVSNKASEERERKSSEFMATANSVKLLEFSVEIDRRYFLLALKYATDPAHVSNIVRKLSPVREDGWMLRQLMTNPLVSFEEQKKSYKAHLESVDFKSATKQLAEETKLSEQDIASIVIDYTALSTFGRDVPLD